MSRRRFLVIAHRGASAYAPESTRAAFARAVAMGADMIELDVQLTRDDRLVVFHDARLERTTDGRGLLRRKTFRQLARLDCGRWFAPRYAGQRILLLSEALRMIPRRVVVNIELKDTARPTVLLRTLRRVLRLTRAEGRTLVSSFHLALLRRAARVIPAVPRALLYRSQPRRALSLARRLGCQALHPHWSVATRPLIRNAHAAQLRVHVWTVDDPRLATRLLRLGVDGIVANAPDRLAALR